MILQRLPFLIIVCLAGCATGPRGQTRNPNDVSGAEPVLTVAQVQALAGRVLENTPEHLHWAPGTTFSWVLFDPDYVVAPEAVRAEVIRQLQQEYTVFQSDDEIPAALKRFSDGQLLGYVDGFSLSLELRFEQGRVIASYHDWEGVLAGSWHTVTYRWIGRKWAVVEKGPMAVS